MTVCISGHTINVFEPQLHLEVATAFPDRLELRKDLRHVSFCYAEKSWNMMS